MAISGERRFCLVALALAMAVVGCGEDGQAEPDSASSPGAGSEAPVDIGHGGAEEAAACIPVGEELEAEATETVGIKLGDYAFAPGMVEVGAGVITFAAENIGTENHELAFLPGRGEVPLNDEGAPDEDALAAAGAFEVERATAS
ncbi:MAG: hypothetical protein M3P53_01370 [Actinomycetota bacterium]|nr:hypothetical protein [Actinomycetota bacterium]